MSRRTGLLGTLVLVAAVAATLAAGGLSASTAAKHSSRSLVGTWVGTVNRPAPLTPIQSLQLFAPGGTGIESSSEPPGERSPQYFSWKRVGARSFKATGVHFRFNPAGQLLGTRRIERTIELSRDGQSFTAVGRVTTLDTSGAVLATGTATSSGVRIRAE